MFYGQCWKCGERWELGTASTCTCVEEPKRPITELLKEALETIKALKQYCESGDPGLEIGATVIAKLEKAIEQPEQPVAWKSFTDEDIYHAFCHVEYETYNDWSKDPEAWCVANARYLEAILKEKNTIQPQRKPLPKDLINLTDEQLEQMWEADKTSPEDCQSLYYFKKIARAVEAKLMERTNVETNA
jgi:hypothetical protein